MTETTMPAAEAAVAMTHESETVSYELAFHVLPTVAEGEVGAVFESLKKIITNHKGKIFDEENPERFDLAYEIVQHIEGKNRKFNSAYFGWVRFTALSAAIAPVTAEIEGQSDILRYLLLKLTKVEEAHPFRFHAALKDQKMVTTVDESRVMPDLTTVVAEDEADEATTEEEGEVDETALEEALEKDEVK